MNEIRTLFEQFWICRDTDRESYYKVKRDIPKFQRFVREQLGWKLVHTEHLLKLEKKPAHAEPFMGIQEFTDIRDYCILCIVLMYLEDMEEQKQFLLSELISYVEARLSEYMTVDWTSFAQRKSLVRVLLYMEKLQMLRVYEGQSEAFSTEAGQEVLYENTGYSRYFASSFPVDISGYKSWRDFETADFDEVEQNRGAMRINRVYRQLAVCPVMYWDGNEDADAYYLKNQRQWVAKYLGENLGGNLDKGRLQKREDECIYLTDEEFADLLFSCRKQWKSGWSKEFREMEEEKLLQTVTEYMKNWMMLRQVEHQVILPPAVGRLTGVYPDDFEGDTGNPAS